MHISNVPADVKVKKLSEDAVVPQYATCGSAGFDFVSSEDIIVLPKQTILVKTGLAFEIPIGYEIQVRPRSGLSLKTKIRVSNSPGTVDSDYRGQVCVIIDNLGDEAFEIKKGDRVAQGVLCPVFQANFQVVGELSDTNRGSGGFGSTGK